MPCPMDWTPGERRVLEIAAADVGWDAAERYAERILAEARMVEGPDLEGLDEPLFGTPAPRRRARR
jgi:hypothetical protein